LRNAPSWCVSNFLLCALDELYIDFKFALDELYMAVSFYGRMPLLHQPYLILSPDNSQGNIACFFTDGDG